MRECGYALGCVCACLCMCVGYAARVFYASSMAACVRPPGLLCKMFCAACHLTVQVLGRG
jgi:hypothetical protein